MKDSERLLGDIERQERRITAVMEDMALEKNYADSDTITRLIATKQELENEHAAMEEQWFLLHDEISTLEEQYGIS